MVPNWFLYLGGFSLIDVDPSAVEVVVYFLDAACVVGGVCLKAREPLPRRRHFRAVYRRGLTEQGNYGTVVLWQQAQS